MTVRATSTPCVPREGTAEPRVDTALAASALRSAGDGLAHAAAGAGDHAAAVVALAAAVDLVEGASGAGLGPTAGEVPVLLRRRLGRALRRLDATVGDGAVGLAAADLLLATGELTRASGSLDEGR